MKSNNVEYLNKHENPKNMNNIYKEPLVEISGKYKKGYHCRSKHFTKLFYDLVME